jgi:hypothetical protein
LRKRFGILIGALGKMEHRELGLLLKRWDDPRNAIQLLRITIIIQSQDQIAPRRAHHPITRSHRTEAN